MSNPSVIDELRALITAVVLCALRFFGIDAAPDAGDDDPDEDYFVLDDYYTTR